MRRVDWAYVAGFFDGEGSASQASGCSSPRMQIVITQKMHAPLEAIGAFLATHGIVATLYGPYPSKSASKLVVSGHDDGSLKFFRGVLPYLIVKKALVEDAMRLLVIFPSMSRFASRLAWDNGRRPPKSHCNFGHAMEGDNVMINNGARRCRTCARRRSRECAQRARAEGKAWRRFARSKNAAAVAARAIKVVLR